ncbi:Ferric reductase, NAD binding protein [Akanthomyces lecanii RCEF 1005]|uniref:Ferric reductase, NAD binding protein n=1 Tax=Akanthomyces lecanii RCEF 1005 TaxID=1081108 RepID=A0A168FGA6_CORDF|nr:Ferric reductase, NAD binding protein [Akanthomyces lecanii RCEF 1005]
MLKPIIVDQYVAARVYFGCVVVIFFLEGIIRNVLLLLSKLHKNKPTPASHWGVTVFLHTTLTRAVPIPYFTDYHVLDVVRFAIFAVLNVIFALNTNQYTTDYTLYGWLTIANGGLAFLLAARSNLFSLILRIPAPVLLQYHRWIGLATVADATVHVSFNIMHFINTDQIMSNLASARIQVGLAAWVCLVIMLLTALPIVRRRSFEVFYYAHFLFFVFIGGALYHTTKGPEFLLPGFGLWVIDRAIRLAYGFRNITVESATYYEGDLTKLRLRGMRAAEPGQMVWLQLSGVSRLNWHPFTVASSVALDGDHAMPTATMTPRTTVAIRGLGGYTSAVQQLAEKEPESAETSISSRNLRVRLDGPYGVSRFNWHDERLVILVAGGVGITPGISIASSIITAATIGSSSPANPPVTTHIHLLWVVKHATHITWFADELHSLHTLLSRQPNPTVRFNVMIHVTSNASSAPMPALEPSNSSSVEMMKQVNTMSSPSNGNPWRLQHGRPDIHRWFTNCKGTAPSVDAAVNVCGPAALVLDVRRASVAQSSGSCLFRIEEESFEL